ncbi:MAG: phospholipid/cholesterol/gamma-HCH transport system substrate-binding protein [Actinomycetota bacterium]|jgi:virulence factor Mce-like protein|nr:phospholipid/cholesterol/gamma-HCH transport system substrate-binding protein [Actinomycetota bacterium]
MTKRFLASIVAAALMISGCSFIGGDGDQSGRIMHARFSRAIQVFPGNSVRVLGVNIGRVITVDNTADAVDVTFRVDDPNISFPADVKATIVPVSLLGERYIQLFPSYNGGPEFTGDTIDLADTSVPAEQDELLRSLQDYFGALDPDKVAEFVTNAAQILESNGQNLNDLIDRGSAAISVLAGKRDSIAELIQEFNTLTTSLSTRQKRIGDVINSYNAVSRTLNDNRDALEGTITGLNQAAAELASLLIQHRDPLNQDIDSLTRTLRTLSRNAGRFTKTAHWAKRLFDTAFRAGDRQRHWLRLGNQGEPIGQLLQNRLQDRLKGVCLRLDIAQCSNMRYWEQKLPNIFCVAPGSCLHDQATPGEKLADTLGNLPGKVGDQLSNELGLKACKKAAHPKRCRARKKKAGNKTPADQLNQILDDILDQVPDPLPSLGDVTDGLGL